MKRYCEICLGIPAFMQQQILKQGEGFLGISYFVAWKLEECLVDNEGRYIIIHVRLGALKSVIITGIYAPNGNQIGF